MEDLLDDEIQPDIIDNRSVTEHSELWAVLMWSRILLIAFPDSAFFHPCCDTRYESLIKSLAPGHGCDGK